MQASLRHDSTNTNEGKSRCQRPFSFIPATLARRRDAADPARRCCNFYSTFALAFATAIVAYASVGALSPSEQAGWYRKAATEWNIKTFEVPLFPGTDAKSTEDNMHVM